MKKSISLFCIILSLYIVVVFVLDTPSVLADGANDDLSANVTIGTSGPSVGAITCVDGATITLNAETTKILNCSATITDSNGYQDISSVRGTFYNSTTESETGDTQDNYKNATCAFTNAGSGTDRNIECTFTVWYHANPADWTVYFNATDAGELTGNNTATITVNTLVALNVTESIIDFETVALGGTSNEITTAIKNTGNVIIDLNINETLYNGYMNCTDADSDDIQTDAAGTGIRYNTTASFAFDDTSWNLTATNSLADVSWAESSDSGAPTAPTNNLYWLLKLPSSGLKGDCSTVVRISAAQDA
ncbi:hypothetical protein GQ473_01885 [archaeon]|nr:hypothetical protein [archaeon]